MVYIKTGSLLSHREKWNFAFCDHMGGPRGHYAKWKKSEKEKYCMISLICRIWKVKQMNHHNKETIDTKNNQVVARGVGGWGAWKK